MTNADCLDILHLFGNINQQVSIDWSANLKVKIKVK